MSHWLDDLEALTPAELEMPNGTTHRVWLDGCIVVRVEGETIDLPTAQQQVGLIYEECQLQES